MPTLKNLFINGIQDKASDRAFVKQGNFRHTENMRFQSTDGNDGVGTNISGTLLVSDSTDNLDDYKCITAYFNEDKDVVYYLLATSDGLKSKIVEYDTVTQSTTIILEDTTGVLNFNKNGYITGINEINGLLLFSEWGNNPRRVNVERAKTYGTDGFTEDDIKVIVKPPFQKIKITLQNTVTASQEENNIEEKFVSFSYRYRYLDGEYSVLAPFTNFAFEPKKFQYDFAEQSNRSMINKWNQVKLDFWTGNERVTEIQLVYKESESQYAWIIDDFNKEKLGWIDNEIKSFTFDNKKTKRALPESVLRNIMDSVPLTAKAQFMIDGRVMYGNYKENYDIIDADDEKIEIDYELELVALPNTVPAEVPTYDEDGNENGTEIIQVASYNPKPTVKSNRDYEVAIVYGDNDGRITTNLLSKKSTIYIPNAKSVTENSIDVILKHNPPKFASWYRFFIKQNKKGYNTIIPTLFFFGGNYTYFQIQPADIDKVKANEYLIAKADTSGVKNGIVKLKVLEVEYQSANFINELNGGQPKGLYIKVSLLDKNVIFDQNSYKYYIFRDYDQTENDDVMFNENTNYSETYFKGRVLNDLTAAVGFSGGVDLRYEVEIMEADVIDKFKWRTQQTDGTFTSWDDNTGLGYDITGTAQVLDADVSITFAAVTGHDIEDKWLIKKNVGFSADEDNRSYAKFVYPKNITIGSVITMKYYMTKERSDNLDEFKITFISNSNYRNLEEWYYGDEIYNQILSEPNFAQSLDKFWFRRMDLTQTPLVLGLTINKFDISATGDNFMLIIESRLSSRNKTRDVYSDVYFEIRSLDNLPIFETEPKDQEPDIYFEIGKNYKIENGFHLAVTSDFETQIPDVATDVNQTPFTNLRVKLDWFNAFSYGNGIESYKIRDEFNAKGLDVGVRPLTNTYDEYKEVTRIADITWSDVYEEESSFNGLNSFNLSLLNFVKLDKENGSIQKLSSSNSNLLVLQEDCIGLMPYNKNVIYDVEGSKTVGVSTNVLAKESFQYYAEGLHGISKNPESFVAYGSRKYFTDQMNGNELRLANNGVTSLKEYLFENYMSNLMKDNKDNFLVGGYDPKNNEYLVYFPSIGKVLAFSETGKGFPTSYTFQPDFMLNANNELYSWRNGKMYRHDASATANNFYGEQCESKILFYVNTEFSIEKIFKAIGLESSHPWKLDISTKLTSRQIPKESFVKLEDYWYSEIMGNTNQSDLANSQYGLGSYPIVNGVITTLKPHNSLSVGDKIKSNTLLFAPLTVTDIEDNVITLSSPINEASSFLIYIKNANINGEAIRGDILEVLMVSDETEKVEIRSVRTETVKSAYS